MSADVVGDLVTDRLTLEPLRRDHTEEMVGVLSIGHAGSERVAENLGLARTGSFDHEGEEVWQRPENLATTSLFSVGNIEVRALSPSDVELLRRIDRTEQLEVEYRVENGKLVSSESTIAVPPWNTTGSGDHSVSQLVAFCEAHLDKGARLLGAFRDGAIVGMAVVEPALRPGMGWLALLHVSNGQRRGGVGQELWRVCMSIVEDSGGDAMYVSATPTGSAVQFYLKQGCRLAEADEIVPELFDAEPDDIHLLCPVIPD